MPRQRLVLRWLHESDLSALIDIERRSEPCDQCFHHIANLVFLPHHQVLVAELDGQPRGFLAYELNDQGVILLKLNVHPSYQALRIGRALLRKLKERTRGLRKSQIITVVDPRVAAGQAFLSRNGFECVVAEETILVYACDLAACPPAVSCRSRDEEITRRAEWLRAQKQSHQKGV